jgi:hypothetical protein
MKNRALQIKDRIFYALLAAFALFSALNIPYIMRIGHRVVALNGLEFHFRYLSLQILAVVCACLGLALVIWSTKLKETREHRIFSMITGISAMGIPVLMGAYGFISFIFNAYLSDLLYGGHLKEPFFFKSLLFICPLVFLIGAIGSIVLLIQSKRVKNED